MSASEKRLFVLLAALMMAAHLWAGFSRSLWTPDEPRVAGIAREMLDHGNWASPTLNGELFTEKPPLYFWAAALAIRAFGVHDWAPRLPSLLFGFGAALFTGLAAARAGGQRAGAASTLALASSALWIQMTQWATVDSAVGCAAAGSMWCLIEGRLASDGRRKALWYLGFYVACCVGMLAKSVPAIIAPGAAVLVITAIERNPRELLRMQPWLGAAIFAAICGPWMLAAWHSGWLAEHLSVHILHRAVSGQGTGHARGVLYYLGTFPLSFLPATLLLVPAALHFTRGSSDDPPERRAGVRLFAAWVVGGFIFYSIPMTKRAIYLLPVLPGAAALVGLYVDSILSGRELGRMAKGFLWALVALLGILAMTPPLYSVAGGGAGPGAVMLAVAAVAVVGVSADALWGGKMAPFWAACVLAVTVALVGLSALTIPEFEPEKSLAPFARLVDRALAEPGAGEVRLVGYQPDETTRGFASFYLGRRLEVVESVQELESILVAPGPKVVITMARNPRTPHRAREMISVEGLAWVRMMALGKKRVAVVAANFVPVTDSSVAGEP